MRIKRKPQFTVTESTKDVAKPKDSINSKNLKKRDRQATQSDSGIEVDSDTELLALEADAAAIDLSSDEDDDYGSSQDLAEVDQKLHSFEPNAPNDDGENSIEVGDDDVEDFSQSDEEDFEFDSNSKVPLEERMIFGGSGKMNPIDPDESDSDVETTNRVGKIPMEWYNDYPHIGYDINGEKIFKPATKDELDQFLSKMDNPDDWRTFTNEYEGKEVTLSKEEIDIIRKLQGDNVADADYNPYEPLVDWFTGTEELTPLNSAPEPKSRFCPSKWEHKKVMKIVRAIRKGLIVPRDPSKPTVKNPYYMLWDDSKDQEREDHPMHVPAPKMRLPETNESYNPPEEYLLTPEEQEKWENTEAEHRRPKVLPQKFNSLRQVPGYENFVRERFERCLDLYLCPRVRKHRIHIDPESLIPKLPSPKELKPFPTTETVNFVGHQGKVRTFNIDPTGQWVVSGSDDNTVKIWELFTGKCLKTWTFDHVVQSVAFNPNKEMSLFGVVSGNNVFLINPGMAHSSFLESTDTIIKNGNATTKTDCPVSWLRPTDEQYEQGYRVILQYPKNVTEVTWHKKGDYFATVSPQAAHSAVMVHQLSKQRTQNPFRKSKGIVQKVLFHPSKPHFLVATKQHVRIYDLMKQELIRKLKSGIKWISSLDVHPQGENVIVGGYDKKVCWFDLDWGSNPYKTLKYHRFAVRKVHFHKRYPLFCSCSDDGTIQVFHGMVYNDLLQNPLIVPVKILKGHDIVDHLGVLCTEFHPTQPWLMSSGSDGTLKLFT